MIMDLEDQSIGIAHNNATHISNVVKHILMTDMQTFLIFPCHMLFENMLTMWYDITLYVSNKRLAILLDILFCVLQL